MTSGTRIRILFAVAIVLAVVVAYWQINESGAMATLLDGGALRQFIIGLGMAGPLAVIGLMTLAILVNPSRASCSPTSVARWRPANWTASCMPCSRSAC